jgi:glycosyltransferase involved in cell wall biosynthesis
MEVAIIHYHLNPGGVSRIIELQIKGMKRISEETDMIILCGNANKLTSVHGVAIKADTQLDYMDVNTTEGQYVKTVSAIMSFITKNLSDHPVLHFHNPNLGKNPSLTMAVYKLASEGIPVINHCHDFPEDRPANLARLNSVIPGLSQLSLQQVMYPGFPWYHFVVLNSNDYKRLLQQDVSASRIHFLPNPVSMTEPSLNSSDKESLKRKIYRMLNLDLTKKICTYPVRAIERKNLGEFILIAALFADVAHFAVTQPPRNPEELPQYNGWKTFCSNNGIVVKFEAGEVVNHEELINISDFCITTSIREGFGMVYLEPWLAGIPVIGRELTGIIGDLKSRGVEFPGLYSGILVETAEGLVDFKDFKPDEQECVIKAVINQHESKLKLYRDNPFLIGLLDDIPVEIILRNQQVIKKRFSIEEYGKELLAIYREISR